MNKILLIDDDVPTNFYNQYILKKHSNNCEIIVKTNGSEALEYLKKAALPHLIFLDINMPVMNGFEFLEEAKRCFKGKWEQTKIFIMMGVELPEAGRHQIDADDNINIINSKMLTKVDIDNIILNKNICN